MGESTPSKTTLNTKAVVFAGLGILLIVIGFCLTPSLSEIAHGLQRQIFSLNLLDPNFFLIADGYFAGASDYVYGGYALGAPFVNTGILVLCVVITYVLSKCDINGGQIAALFMVLGFGFCGKTFVNVWPLVLGVLIEAAVTKKSFASVMNIAWFSTALSPIFNTVAFYSLLDGSNMRGDVPVVRAGALVFAILLCIVAGYGVGFFAGILPKKHNGYTLYNVGFAAGVVGFLLYSTLKVFGIAHNGPNHQYPDVAKVALALSIVVILLYLLVCGLVIERKSLSKIPALLARSDKGGCHVTLYGFGAALVNMAFMGFVFLVYTLFIRASLSGAVFAAFFTAVGFSANGITFKSAFPIMLGIFVTSLVSAGVKGALTGGSFLEEGFKYVGTKNMAIAALYACGLSPVTGAHGPLAGFLIGAIHSVIVPNTGSLHGWLCLYNNGFSMGIVATLYTHFFEKLTNPWKKTLEG